MTSYLSWRRVLFVNVPIGLLTAAAARLVLPESARNRGRFDLAGAIAGTGGVALLVYGLSNAGADQSGVSHCGDTRVIASLRSGVVFLPLAALVITVITIRVRREDLPGTPEPALDRPAGAEPALEQARS